MNNKKDNAIGARERHHRGLVQEQHRGNGAAHVWAVAGRGLHGKAREQSLCAVGKKAQREKRGDDRQGRA